MSEDIVSELRELQWAYSPKLSDLARRAADEIERLRTIVDRIPQNADGAHILPGAASAAEGGE